MRADLNHGRMKSQAINELRATTSSMRRATAGLVFHVTGKRLHPVWHMRGRALPDGAQVALMS